MLEMEVGSRFWYNGKLCEVKTNDRYCSDRCIFYKDKDECPNTKCRVWERHDGLSVTFEYVEHGRDEMLMKIPISELELTVRSENCLRCNGITNLYQIKNLSVSDLKGFKNLGKKSLTEIIEKLADYGLSLKEDDKNDG